MMEGNTANEARKRKVEPTLPESPSLHDSKKQKGSAAIKLDITHDFDSDSPDPEDGTIKVSENINAAGQKETDHPDIEIIDSDVDYVNEEDSDLDEDEYDDIENLQKYVLSDDMEDDHSSTCRDEDSYDGEHYQEKEYEVEEFQYTIPGNPAKEVTIKAFLTKDLEDQEFLLWMQPVFVTCSYQGKVIGGVDAKYIDRRYIRRNFWRDMEEPTQDTSHLAFHLFDRYGCLQARWKDHEIRKGSGAWGSELDVGQLLLIETISVDALWRKQGIGKVLISTLTDKAKKLKHGLDFSLAITGCLNYVISEETKELSLSEEMKVRKQHCEISDVFFRAVGFRRVGASRCFGIAADLNHPAHQIKSADDYNPQKSDDIEVPEFKDDPSEHHHDRHRRYEDLLRRTKEQRFPMHHKLVDLADKDCVAFLQSQKELGFSDWNALDHQHDNLLHILAREIKPLSVQWLLQTVGQDSTICNGRNIKGYTPMEALQATLEKIRTRIDRGNLMICIMDQFEGFSSDAVTCLTLLGGLNNPTRIQLLQMKYGCTCGACIGGMLSPRQRYILLGEADINGDLTAMDTDDAETWLVSNSSHIAYVAPDIQRNFRTNKSLRQGFANVFQYIATCLRRSKLPTTANVVKVWENESEWPPVTKSYFQRGGTVVSALKYVFDFALEQDKQVGDGWFFDVPEFETLPECRNDHEYGFVARACGVDGIGTVY